MRVLLLPEVLKTHILRPEEWEGVCLVGQGMCAECVKVQDSRGAHSVGAMGSWRLVRAFGPGTPQTQMGVKLPFARSC